MGEGRQVWKFSLIIEATDDDAERVSEAIARALCPDDEHDGPCEVPWTMLQCRFEDLDDDEQRLWKEDLDAERPLNAASTDPTE